MHSREHWTYVLVVSFFADVALAALAAGGGGKRSSAQARLARPSLSDADALAERARDL